MFIYKMKFYLLEKQYQKVENLSGNMIKMIKDLYWQMILKIMLAQNKSYKGTKNLINYLIIH